MKKLLLIATIAMSVLMSSCGLKRQVTIYDTYPATQGRIIVYQTAQQLPNNIIQIGTVVVGDEGFTTPKNCSYEACMEAIQEESKKMGGQLIHIAHMKSPEYMGGCYYITADIYRYKE